MADYPKFLEKVMCEAAAELRRLKKLVDDCTDYLKDGETPRMALDRWARIMADDWYKPK